MMKIDVDISSNMPCPHRNWAFLKIPVKINGKFVIYSGQSLNLKILLRARGITCKALNVATIIFVT